MLTSVKVFFPGQFTVGVLGAVRVVVAGAVAVAVRGAVGWSPVPSTGDVGCDATRCGGLSGAACGDLGCWRLRCAGTASWAGAGVGVAAGGFVGCRAGPATWLAGEGLGGGVKRRANQKPDPNIIPIKMREIIGMDHFGCFFDLSAS
jgi:hypothetical protein